MTYASFVASGRRYWRQVFFDDTVWVFQRYGGVWKNAVSTRKGCYGGFFRELWTWGKGNSIGTLTHVEFFPLTKHQYEVFCHLAK